MDRLFLDANVLFSAAYHERAGLQRLWDLSDVQLICSPFALEEARRNLSKAEQVERLNQLVEAMDVAPGSGGKAERPEGIMLPEKDWPILLGAIARQATHLLTGDMQHFGVYMDRDIAGIRIQRPGPYLRSRS